MNTNAAGEVVGTVGNTTYFTISNSGSVVTFTQSNNIQHSDSSNADDSETLASLAKSVVLTQTITDKDGDTDSTSLDLSNSVFEIQDDGPAANALTAQATAKLY